MKIKLFVDFDGTLFDTSLFKEKLFEIFKLTGATDDEIMHCYNSECLDFKYSPFSNLEKLYQLKQFDIEAARRDINELCSESYKYVYADSDHFLSEIDRNQYELNLLTLGDIEFQRSKVENSKLTKHFNNIYYCENQKWDFIEKLVDQNEKFIIIDDRGDTAEKIKAKFKRSMPIMIDRFDRIEDNYTPKDNFQGLTIKNLKQAIQYL